MEPLSSDNSDESSWLEKLQQADLFLDCRIVPTSDTGHQAITGVNKVNAAWLSDKCGSQVTGKGG